MSSISAEETTSSWEEIVDMMAASTAVSTRPAISGWKRIWPMSRKIVSKLIWSTILISGFSVKNAGPMIATKTVPTMDRPIQVTP